MGERTTKRVATKVVDTVDKPTMHAFVGQNVRPGTQVYTDEATAYSGLPYPHESVAHINGMEGYWSMLKRGYHGTYHKWSAKHLHRYLAEFEGRQNVREEDTMDQMEDIAFRMDGKRLRYADPIAPNGKASGARRKKT